MIDARTEYASSDTAQPPEHLGSGIVALWLVIGSALVATALVTLGWRTTLAVWFGSGTVLGLLFLVERRWHRHSADE